MARKGKKKYAISPEMAALTASYVAAARPVIQLKKPPPAPSRSKMKEANRKTPRTRLAKAAAISSQRAWHSPGLSEAEKDRAYEDYERVQDEIRESGGRLTQREINIGKKAARNWIKRQSLPPPPTPRLLSPDAADLNAAARASNIARGAAPRGGMGKAERDRVEKALAAPEKERGDKILAELARQGYATPKTPEQAQRQFKDLLGKTGTSLREAVRQAQQQPFDVRRNTKLIGLDAAQQLSLQARALQPPPPKESEWVKATESGLDWIVPERVERAAERSGAAWMGITPSSLQPAARNLKEVTADIAMAFPVLGETIYNDLVGNTRWGTAKVAREGVVEWGKGIERAVPGLPEDLGEALGLVKEGEWGKLGDEMKRDLHRAANEWQNKPFSALLNVYPALSGAVRVAEFPSLVRNIGKANPNMTVAQVLMAARKESFRPGFGAVQNARFRAGTVKKPGYKGGIPKRILEGKLVDPETGETLSSFKAAARPPSRSALGRRMQGRYDKFSRLVDPSTRVFGRFSELRRASTALRRRRTLEAERNRTVLLQQIAPVERYIRQSGIKAKAKNVLLGRLAENRARLAETFYGPQGPSGIDVNETLRAVSADLKNIVEEGGQEIPSNRLGKINKEIQRVDLRLAKHGLEVTLGTGMWANAANVMRDAGYTQEQIEVNLELAAAAARAWAKREPGRDPNDWLSSPEGRNLVGFEFGAPPAEALGQSLFQVLYPGDPDVPMTDGNPYRTNRAALAEDPDIPVDFVPEPLPFTTGTQLGPRGTPVATHSSRHAEAQQDLHEVWDFENNRPLEGADPKKVADIEALLPDEGRWLTDREGNEVWVGRTSLQQKDARMTRFMETLDPDQQELFRRWYERVWDYVAYLYGPEKMKKFGNAFFASQAAQSPAGGIMMLYRVAADIEAGKPMPTGKNQWLQRNVWKLMTGEDLGQNPSGIAAKLMDFFASGAGMNMRAIYGAVKDIGPGVVDRWTWRSDGYITKTEKGEMMSSRVSGVTPSKKLGTTRGKAVAYEYSNTRLQMLTDLWNREKRFGRDDWTVDQIQAIDWFATKKEWVDNKWTPVTAEGGSPLDMAIHNTREVSFKGDAETLQRIVEDAGAGVSMFRGRRAGKEALTSTSEAGWTHAIVAGASKSLNALELALGREGHTFVTKYPGQFGGTAAKRSHQIDIPRDRKQAASDALRELGIKPRDHPSILEWGEDSYRIDFGRGKRAQARAEAIGEALGVPVEARLLTKRGRGVRPTVLEQRGAEGVRGAVQFLDTDSGRQLLYLSEHANASTFAHELFGHAAHEMKRELPAEFAKIEKRYGRELEDWTEADHERLATEVERYLTSGKAPTPELQPLFTAMKAWMRTVYETIKTLGNGPYPDTKALMDRYFGKEPIDFTPPQRLRRGLPDPTDLAAIDTLIDDTGNLLLHGADVLRQDPKRRKLIAGNMKWLEQQVLPFVREMDSDVSDKLHDLFDEYEEMQRGSSIFSADERRLIEARGKLLAQRHGQLRKMENSLRAQPDHALLEEARDVMDDLDNAETLEDIQEAIKDLKVVSKETGRRTRFENESQRLLARQVKDLERALSGDRKVTKAERDEAIGVLREISGQMTHMFTEIFGEGLGPEGLEMLKRSLAVRDNLVPTRLRELGLLDEGTGSGAYMPHYSIFDKLFSKVRGPVRLPAAGRNRKNLSMQVKAGQETFGKGTNKLIRYGTGTLQVDPRALLSAYKNRMRFLETSQLRKQVYDIGVEIPKRADGNPRIPEGWYIINATGNAIPERLKALATMSEKQIDELLASGEDFDSLLKTEEGTIKMLEEYRDSWLQKEEGGKPPKEWDSDKLRMVPPEVVETLIGKVFESTPGGSVQSLAGLVALSARTATIFAKPIGYIHANVAANGMLLALTNPTRAPRAIMEFLKLPVSLRARNPKLYEDITVQTGDIKAEAGLQDFYVGAQSGLERTERVATEYGRAWASFLGDFADQPFRVASWTGHARKYGFNDEAGWHELIHSDDPEIAHIREIVSQRAREDMLDFNKLSPGEQRMARYLFIWPFIRASAAQPLWLMREYPARMTAMATAARAQEQAYEGEDIDSMREKYNEISPAADRTMFDLNEVPIGGGSVNMGPVNPVGTFAEKFVDVANLMANPKDISAIGDIYNPAFRHLFAGFGGREMDWERVMDSTIPLASYALAATNAKFRGAQKYTDRSSWFDYVRRRDLRFAPEKVDPEKIREAGEKEKDKLDQRPTWEKNAEEDMEWYEQIAAKYRATGKNIGPKSQAKIEKSITAYNDLDREESKLADKLGKPVDDLTETEKLEATYKVVFTHYPQAKLYSPEKIANLPDKSRGDAMSKQKYRYALRDAVGEWRSTFMSIGRDLGLDIP